MHETRHVYRLLQNLRISIIINECEQLIENILYILNFLQVHTDEIGFGRESLLFPIELFLEFSFQFLLLIFKLCKQISKSLINVLQLLLLKPCQLNLGLIK